LQTYKKIGIRQKPAQSPDLSELDAMCIFAETILTMPTVLFIFGIRFFFYPNDHEPIHVHVEYQGKSAKIQVAPEVCVIENNGLKARTIAKALEAVNFYREDIIAAWNDIFSKK